MALLIIQYTTLFPSILQCSLSVREGGINVLLLVLVLFVDSPLALRHMSLQSQPFIQREVCLIKNGGDICQWKES